MNLYNFEVTCINDYMEDDEVGEIWSAGQTYKCSTKDFKTFEIDTNQNTIGIIGPGYLLATDDFKEYFEVTTGIDCPIPTEFLSYKSRDDIYRHVWKEHVAEDVRSHIEDTDVELSDDDIDEIAEIYVYNGKYDCNLSYWQNLDNLINSN